AECGDEVKDDDDDGDEDGGAGDVPVGLADTIRYVTLPPYFWEMFCELYPHHCVPDIWPWDPLRMPIAPPGPGPDPAALSPSEKRKFDRIAKKLDKAILKWDDLRPDLGSVPPPAPL